MTKTYLFYDIETTGLNKAFDQVLQFAAVRTDRQLNEVRRFTLKIQLRPDVIPSPGAVITNRIALKDLTTGQSEYEAIRQIHQLMNRRNTISLGYNSLGFDDEFLRFAFHRNLLPAYTHQFKNGCRRMDLLPITVMYWLYNRGIINWPEVKSKPSLKLEHISEVNQLTGGPAHDAAVDVMATVALARKFFKNQKMWNYLLGYFEKETDAHRISDIPATFQSALGDHRWGLMVSSEYGPRLMYQVPVLSIGSSIPYSNQTLWLRLDSPGLPETKADTIDETTWVIRKRYGEPGILLPPNRRYMKLLDTERKAIATENLKWLHSNPALFQQIANYHRNHTYPYIPNLDPDAALYQIGFFSRGDEMLFKKFQTAAPHEMEHIAHRLSSPDARVLANRVIGRNFPQFLSQESATEFEAYMRRVNPSREDRALQDYTGALRLTPAAALTEIKHLRESKVLDDEQLTLLEELQDYIKTNFPRRGAGKQLSIGKNF
ncbi:MAG: exonuclease domain-containing protein [Desulfobacterales bacterium]|jgi:exodeoxyribonuclease-1